MYTSTRKKLNLNASSCILKGISDDGGLFITNSFSEFKFDESFLNKSYKEISKEVLKYFLNDFDEGISRIIDNAYGEKNFKEKIVDIKSFDKLSFLELYHGPTLAFKDMALTVLPHLMVESKKLTNYPKKTLILTATSGDTCGAALSGFKDVDDVVIVVLYPTNGVSNFQESQMLYYTGKNSFAISVEGNFDDCQNLVKKIFTSGLELKNFELSSANSINIGRLVPQIIYYFYTYVSMVNNKEIKFGEKINFVVPTGNFGNILACYIAKQMGLYIDKIICASNENNVLTDFFTTYTYNKNREFFLTNSPAMDILISSNLERLLYIITDNNEVLVKELMDSLKLSGKFTLPKQYQNKLNDFKACSITKEETVENIKACYEKYHYLIDPHTAVGYGAYNNFSDELKGKTVVVSTASPYKFVETVNEVFKVEGTGLKCIEKIAEITNTNVPKILYDIYNSNHQNIVWKKEEMENNLRKLIGEIDENY